MSCGLENPRQIEKPKVELTFEVPISFDGVYPRRNTSAFLVDEQGQIFLGHTGYIRQYKHRLTKSDRFDWRPVIWPDERETSMIIVARVDPDSFVNEVSKFVNDAIDEMNPADWGHY